MDDIGDARHSEGAAPHMGYLANDTTTHPFGNFKERFSHG